MDMKGDQWVGPPGDSNVLQYARSCENFLEQTWENTRYGPALGSIIFNYLRSILPPSVASQPSGKAILEWLYSLEKQSFNITRPGDSHMTKVDWYQYAVFRVAEEDGTCMERACLASVGRIEADPDLAGIGVLSSYCVEAALVTAFFLVLVLLARGNKRGAAGVKTRMIITRLVDVHRGSLYDMFLGASLLCFGVQIAALQLYGSKGPDTPLFFLVNNLVSSFAILPLLALCCLVDRTRHVRIRYWFFRAATFVLYGMWMGVIWLTVAKQPELSFMFMFLQSTRKSKLILGDFVDKIHPHLRGYCNNHFDAYTDYLKLAVVCVWAVMLIPPGMYLTIGAVRLIERLRGSTTKAASRLTSRLFRIVLPFFCLVGMWTILGLIMHIRGVLTTVSRDERSTLEINKWEIGQILAILIWIPVVIEMGRIAAIGLRAVGFRDVLGENDKPPGHKPEMPGGNGSYSGHHSDFSDDEIPLVAIRQPPKASTR